MNHINSLIGDIIVLFILGISALILILKAKETQNFILEKRRKYKFIKNILPHYGDTYSAHTESIYRTIGFVALAAFILSLYRVIRG